MSTRPIAFKFVKHDVKPLETYKDTFAYKARVKLLNGKKLTRKEKNDIVSSFAFENGVIKIGGWAFSFRNEMKTYLVKQYDRWQEYMAFDKTSLRTILSGTIQRIVEID